MRFVVVRSSAPGCEPNCPEWISAEGAIEAETPAKVKRVLKTLGGRRLPIVVNSPGGSVEAAILLGRTIRKNKLDIAVGATKFVGCWPGMEDCRTNDGKGAAYFGIAKDGGAMCNSACPLMFAGGVRRLVGSWAYLGVHQITTTYRRQQLYYRTTYRIVHGKKKIVSSKVVDRVDVGTYQTYEMSKALQRRLSAYLREMGVGEGVLDVMKATPASDIRRIVLQDMMTMKLATGTDTVDLLTSASLCMVDKPPPSCREVPGNTKPGVSKPKTVSLQQAEVPPSQPAKAPAAEPFKRAAGNAAPEMRFVVVRGSDPLCDPDCPEWISAEGTIVSGTAAKLRQLLDTIGGRRLPMIINSPGGDVQVALAAGRLIRERGLDVAVARTNFVDCDAGSVGCDATDGQRNGFALDAGAECDAACAVMVAGGTRRFVGANAHFLVHSMGMEEKVRVYLDEMAIGSGFFVAMQSAQYAKHRELSRDELREFGLTTGPQSVDALTGTAICKSSPKPDNCRPPSAIDATAGPPPKI
ncbi:MAG: hypothetical protein EOQ50_32540 [Mesorhizobium sp.]|nr:hypothetical protein [Mesorhizobium sp.]RWB66335.1 MAG: hypothetical protein EOQ50_32540 [Mesorhizobium sp.]